MGHTQKRIGKARKQEAILKQVIQLVESGISLNQAIKKVLPADRRSWAIRKYKQYKENGIEALIDRRMPRCNDISDECKELIRESRILNPRLTVKEAMDILIEHKIIRLPSPTSIKREFQKAEQQRKKLFQGQEKQKGEASVEQIIELPAAGAELLLAAEIETSIIRTLTDETEKCAIAARIASEGRIAEKDSDLRDDKGRFTSAYNHARTREQGELIASYLLPSEQKGSEKVPNWPRFVREKWSTLNRKMIALTFEPLVNPTRGWNGLLSPGLDKALETICGYGYMPSTLSKLTSALAQSGTGSIFLESLGQVWHEVAQQRWHEQGSMVVLYVDNHAKEVWSSLFTKAGKVSHRSRVMPCITSTYVHTGAGAPIYISLQSGSAPLAPKLINIVEQAEKNLDEEIRAMTIIDAEGSTFDIFKSFIAKKRIIVTPLRESQRSNVDFYFGPGSFYRPFRENDQYRVGEATLHHKKSGQSLTLDAVLLKRNSDGREMVLLMNCTQLEVSPRTGAEAYFKRWSVQENAFRDGAISVKLNSHRGKCAQIVSNIAVVDELERLEGRIITSEEQLSKVHQRIKDEQSKVEQLRTQFEKESEKATEANKKISVLREKPEENIQELTTTVLSLQESIDQKEVLKTNLLTEESKLTNFRDKKDNLEEKIDNMVSRCEHLEPMQNIRQLDLSLDMLMTTFKLAATLLITFVCREYMSIRPMLPETFKTRFMSLRGQRIISLDKERIVFFENPRDREMTEVLRDACLKLNRRKLIREGRNLIYETRAPN